MGMRRTPYRATTSSRAYDGVFTIRWCSFGSSGMFARVASGRSAEEGTIRAFREAERDGPLLGAKIQSKKCQNSFPLEPFPNSSGLTPPLPPLHSFSDRLHHPCRSTPLRLRRRPLRRPRRRSRRPSSTGAFGAHFQRERQSLSPCCPLLRRKLRSVLTFEGEGGHT